MPVIVVNDNAAGAATVQNAIDGLKFDTLDGPALITLYASTSNEGDTISYSVGQNDFLVDAEPNTEAASGVVDTDRDAILVREPVPSGKQFLRMVHGAAGNIKAMLVIEEVPQGF